MNPTPVAVNKAEAGERLIDPDFEVDTLTINDLRRDFHPKPLFFGVMEVDELREEENNRCSPKHYDIQVRGRGVVRNERNMPTAKP